MERLAPAGDVYQAGTLSGNPLATAAGLSVLRRLRDPAVYEELERQAARCSRPGSTPFGRVQRVGAMLTLFLADGAIRNFEDAQAADTERYGALFRHLLERGIYVAPSPVRVPVPLARALATTRSSGRSRRLAISSATDVLDAIAAEAAAESPLWGEALRADAGARAGLLAARARAVRARPRDDLRGRTSSTTAGRGCSRRPTRTRRCCSATTSTRTASSASPTPASVDAVAALAELISPALHLRADGARRRRRRVGRGRRAGSAARRTTTAVDARARGARRTGRVSSRRDLPGCSPTLPKRAATSSTGCSIVGLIFLAVIALGERRALRPATAAAERSRAAPPRLAAMAPARRPARVDRAARARGRARPRLRRGRSRPRGHRDRRPHRARPAGRRSSSSARRARAIPLLINQFGTERRMCLAFGVERLDDVAEQARRRARDAAAAGARRQGARPEEAEVDRRLAAEDRLAAAPARRSCSPATTSTSACCRSSAAGPATPAPFITLPAVITQRPAHRRRATSACTGCRRSTRARPACTGRSTRTAAPTTSPPTGGSRSRSRSGSTRSPRTRRARRCRSTSTS